MKNINLHQKYFEKHELTSKIIINLTQIKKLSIKKSQESQKNDFKKKFIEKFKDCLF